MKCMLTNFSNSILNGTVTSLKFQDINLILVEKVIRSPNPLFPLI